MVAFHREWVDSNGLLQIKLERQSKEVAEPLGTEGGFKGGGIAS